MQPNRWRSRGGRSSAAAPMASPEPTTTESTPMPTRADEAYATYGSYAGPPERPTAIGVGSTSLLLEWSAPQHLGGAGFEVLGYRIFMRMGGAGDFHVHVADTAVITKLAEEHHAVEELAPDTWHEFKVAAITAAGVGALSLASHPVLFDEAPKLLRDLARATRSIKLIKTKLAAKRERLVRLASEATLQPGQQGVRDARGAMQDGGRCSNRTSSTSCAG
jgi:hypothetical protein